MAIYMRRCWERCCLFPMQALITEQLELLHGTAGGGGRTIPKVMMAVLSPPMMDVGSPPMVPPLVSPLCF